MTRYRDIDFIVPGSPFHWVGNGFRVMNYFPATQDLQQRLSPFLLLDYNPAFYFAPTMAPRGVGVHPHRGFETVTIAYQGAVAHHDSTGRSGIINPGDVQWMTAGAGILHKEYHAPAFASKGGVLQLVQLWINLPKDHKLTPPHYQSILAEQINQVALAQQAGVVRVIAGEFGGMKGAAMTFTPINLLDIRLNPQGVMELSLPENDNTALLILEGEVTINLVKTAQTNDLVIFKNAGQLIRLAATSNPAVVLLLSGQPLNEPIAHYGPFVMNTQQQLQQALEDYRSGRFGELE